MLNKLWKDKTGLLVGRFQPFHLGHLYLIKKGLKYCNHLIIAIGSANVVDDNNPLDIEKRIKIIKAVVYKENLIDKIVKIVALNDYYNDEKWLNNVKKQTGQFDLVIGNNDWTNNILKKAGYKILSLPYYRRYMYEGWRIRKLVVSKKPWKNRVPKYLVKVLSSTLIEKPTFSHLVLGGTFDHLHKGHQVLLTKAIEVGKRVTIGIATEELFKNKPLSQSIEPFLVRKNNVLAYIKNKIQPANLNLISFSDIYGSADKDKTIDGLVVSKAVFGNGVKINEARVKKGYRESKLILVPDILAEDGKLISSERIRRGEINREGKKYRIDFKGKQKIIMPESLRITLQKPIGRIFKIDKKMVGYIKSKKPIMLITVGDIITDSLIKNKINPDVKIIDLRSRRKPILKRNSFFTLPLVLNQPGTVSVKATEAIKASIEKFLFNKKKQTVIVNGEEDLLALPAILFAPLNSLVIYGHWKLGVVAVEIDEKIKEQIVKILSEFE